MIVFDLFLGANKGYRQKLDMYSYHAHQSARFCVELIFAMAQFLFDNGIPFPSGLVVPASC